MAAGQMQGCAGRGGAGGGGEAECRGVVFHNGSGDESKSRSSYVGVVLLPLLGREGGGGLLPAKKVDAMVEVVGRRTNMIVRKERRAGGSRSSHLKQLERRDDQEVWRVDEYMGGEVE